MPATLDSLWKTMKRCRRSGYRKMKLTLLKPTYSLYWFVSAARLLTEPFGLPFSTWILAWLMGFAGIADNLFH